MKFEVSFNYLDTEDKTVRGYDYHPLYDEIKDLTKTYILALDNDEAGNIAKESLAKFFDSENIKYGVFDNCGFKDANKALVEDKKQFENSIYKLIEQFDIKLKKLNEVEM